MADNDSRAKTRYFTVATAGHVDHGKTSLLKRLTGMDPDRLKEEKERQMTTDLGFVHLTLPPDLGIGFIDVPGHGKFLKNMLAGVGAIDMALLVVAADEGPMPQTHQHLKIVSLLGVARALVAVSKCDLVSPARAQDVAGQVCELVRAAGPEVSGCVCLSSSTGEGFERLREVLARCLDGLPTRSCDGAAFLAVDRAFTKSGFGTIVTGTLARGNLRTGDQVFIEPGDVRARIRRLESLGRPVEKAGPGQRVALNLVVKEGGQLARGQVISRRALSPSFSLVVSISGWHDKEGEDLRERLKDHEVRFYHGTAESRARMGWVEPLPAESAMYGQAVGQLSLVDPVVAEPGDRYVCRVGDDIIYGGTVLLRERPRWLSRARVVDVAAGVLAGSYRTALMSFLAASPQRVLKEAQLERLLPERVRQSTVDEMVRRGDVVRLGGLLLAIAAWKELSARLVAEVTLSGGDQMSRDQALSMEHLRTKAFPALDRTAFQALVQQLVDSGSIVRKGDRLMLPDKSQPLVDDPARARLREQIGKILASNLCLELDEIARLAGVPARQAKAAVEELAGSKQAFVVDYQYAASAYSLRKAHAVLAEMWQNKREIAPGAFRERLGTSRKYAMALLAFFDDHQITRRLASGRVLIKRPEEVWGAD